MMWTLDPWMELERMQRELEGLLGRRTRPVSPRTFPPINVYDRGEELTVVVELPGMDKDDVTITYVEGTLVIAGRRELPEDVAKMKLLRHERPRGRFEKAFEIPYKIDAERIAAAFKNGVMQISLPKAEEAKPKQISVTVE